MRKRTNGEGSFSRLKSGSWRVQFMDGFTEIGKRRIVSFTAPTKSELQQKVRNYFSNKETGIAPLAAVKNAHVEESQTDKRQDSKAGKPFNEWADVWYADYKSQLQNSTYSNYQYTLKSLKNYFGSTPINEIMLIDINKYLDFLKEKNYSNSKISKCKSMLIQIFGFAEDNDLIVKNPALRAKTVRDLDFDKQNNSKDAFTPEEVELLMKYLPDDLLGNSIRVLINTGIRVQELLALTPKDIADDGSSINVNKAIKTVNGKSTLGTTKSKKSMRIVPVPDDVRGTVKKLKEQGGKVFIWMSKRKDFLYNVKWFRTQYYRAIKEVPGVRTLSPHCCRHTYVTRLEAAGVPIQLIAKLAGHSHFETTIGYTHTDIDTLREAVNKMK